MKTKLLSFLLIIFLCGCNFSSKDTTLEEVPIKTPSEIENFTFPSDSFVDNSPSENYESKRGICYNELSANQINLLSGKNVSWAYNWGKTSENPYIDANEKLTYAPMFWGGASDEDIELVRNYIKANPSVKYILGFNEPNMGNAQGGCAMLPSTAAALWPKLEALAEECNVALVSPAMTYSGYNFGTEENEIIYGTPESWLDEFISEYKKNNEGKEPRMDYIALHSYMAWPSAIIWYCENYAKMYNKPILLTEFCAWHDEGVPITENWQAQKLAQKIEAMDKNPYIAGYAWFKADGTVNERPWNSLFTENNENLSLCGLIYQHLGSNDANKWFEENKGIPAVSYISSSNYDMEKGKTADDGEKFENPLEFEKSTDSESQKQIPLIITNFKKNDYMNYQIEVSETGMYDLIFRYSSTKDKYLKINTEIFNFKSTAGKWKTYKISIKLQKGQQILKVQSNGSDTGLNLAWLCFKKSD